MLLRDQFNEDLKSAMKARDALRVDVLRMVKAAVKNKEIELGHELSDAETTKVLGTSIKQRRDAAEQYQRGRRPELASKELQEIVLIEKYLPKAPSSAEIDAAIDEAIREANAMSARDIGAVMKAVMRRFEGQAVDGKAINAKVRERLQ
ncbi:MAG: GatB/YqeY domain-containing protein [Acidobacteria bacterium]|nr:GatB/YqeY domain-containing protein [Acidobacteriota bacterium]